MTYRPSRESLVFRKSSYSNANGGCVETAAVGGRSYVADTKDPAGPMLPFDGVAWASFLTGVRRRP